MKSFFIENYYEWKQLNESIFGIGKSKEVMIDSSGKKHKVVINFKDNNTFKVKIINDRDILDTNSKLTEEGFRILFNYLNNENSFINTYGKIDEDFFKNKFLVYTVLRDNDKRQIITFNIQQRSNIENLPKDLKYVSYSDLVSNNYLNSKNPQENTILKDINKEASKPMDPVEKKEEEKTEEVKEKLISIEDSKFPIIRNNVKNEVNDDVKKVQSAILNKFSKVLNNSETFNKFKKYGADGKYGPTTSTIISMIKAGYKLSDTNGNTITKELVDKINFEPISESYICPFEYKLIEGFDINAALSIEKKYNKGSSINNEEKNSKEDSEKSEKINYNKHWKFLIMLTKEIKNKPYLKGIKASYGKSKTKEGEFIAFVNKENTIKAIIYEIDSSVLIKDIINNKTYKGKYLSSNEGGSVDSIINSKIKINNNIVKTINDIVQAKDIREIIED